MNNLTCIACKHFYFESGMPTYSEYTLGYDATIKCMKKHWKIDMSDDDNESYRLKLLTAEGCKDFEAYQKV